MANAFVNWQFYIDELEKNVLSNRSDNAQL